MKESPDSAAFLRAHEQACKNVRLSSMGPAVPCNTTPTRPATQTTPTESRSPVVLESFRPFSVALSDDSDFPIIRAPMDSPVLPNLLEFPHGNPSPILQDTHMSPDYVIILSLRYAFGFKYYKVCD
jgi:hypothetical protein